MDGYSQGDCACGAPSSVRARPGDNRECRVHADGRSFVQFSELDGLPTCGNFKSGLSATPRNSRLCISTLVRGQSAGAEQRSTRRSPAL
jgi:hypothetical protein